MNLKWSEEKRLHEIIARDEIMQLVQNYMRAQDRLDPVLHRSVFHADAWLSYGIYEGGPDGFVEFAQNALRPHKANHHMIGQVQIDVEDLEAFGEVYYQAHHRIEEDGQEYDLFISGRYVDRYENRFGVWKIAYRSELVDWVRKEPATGDYLSASKMLPGARKPADPLYHRDKMRKPKDQ
ncbi:nuclear transport factor 2 family protein [Iodidimonas sp. SYSU 1G8]|uniref:nuclear transport factor 2 family protein n=1 Tax=Iodidimonas sp. SYSU 1G8 TaxID=3133967 RepID=UPI0031FF410B